MKTRKPPIALALSLMLASPLAAQADTDLKAEVERLKAQNREILERLDATAELLESGRAGQPVGTTEAGPHDHAMPTTGSMRQRTFGIHGRTGSTLIGGYGEMHYNNLEQKDSGSPKSDKKAMDFHRFILFMGHEFSERIRFWSELEVEHAYLNDNNDGSGDTAPGEVSVEQAFLEFDLNDNTSARAGILLIPVGFINETHEPPTFYGVERNNVAKNIIPTTWREGGAGLTGRFGQGFSYDLLVHTGLKTSGSSNYAVRKGRTGVGAAPADNLAVTARLNWVGMPGLLVGGAVQRQTDITQGTDANAGAATLLSGHFSWQTGPFQLLGVYATWSLDGSGPATAGADRQTGWYVEPSWKVTPKFGVFARYSTWDNQVNSGTDTAYSQRDIGFNYWPHENVVLKFDYQDQSTPTGSAEYDGINLGVGYMF